MAECRKDAGMIYAIPKGLGEGIFIPRLHRGINRQCDREPVGVLVRKMILPLG